MMDNLNIDNWLAAAGVIAKLALLFILFQRKLYKVFPIFTAYTIFETVEDPLEFLWMRLLHIPSSQMTASPAYLHMYYGFSIPEYLLAFGVLFEIARNVLQPVKRSLPPISILVFVVLVVIGGGLAYLLAGQGPSGSLLNRLGDTLLKITAMNAILRILCFTVIAVFAQVLGIGWKNHVLQLATGLAFYGALDLVIRLTVRYLAAKTTDPSIYYPEFRKLDELRVIGYLSTLTFWCWSFARKEAPRKEFSPKMAEFVVSISGAAKRDRDRFGR